MLDWLLKLRGPMLNDYGFLRTDMHAHWLPGIDDGAKDIEESLQMIKSLRAMGYRRLVATPHIMHELYRNTPEIIHERLATVRKACREADIDIELDAAAEYLLDEKFESHLEQYGPLLIGSQRYILIEFGFYQAPLDANRVFFRLTTGGFRVILAHPERYPYYHGKPEKLQAFRERGVLLQVNTLSLLGHYGSQVQKAAVTLIDRGMVDFLGTDAHSMAHLAKLRIGLQDRRVGRLLQDVNFQNSAISLN